jgi:AraC-like DNA-binding protein
MEVFFATPSELLSPYIKRYWAIENTLDKDERCVQRIIPTGFCELMLYFTPHPKILDNNKSLTDNTALYGHHNRFYDIELQDDLSVFSVVFQPQGLMRFFRFPISEICNQSVPLCLLMGQPAKELEQKMGKAGTFHQRVNIVESYFLGLLKNNDSEFEFKRINHLAELIQQTQGKININQMASEVCLSRKQFERIFAEKIGITPKQYLKTIRFQAAIYKKQQNAHLNMTELSYESGYFDQSHFINDFKTLSGLTPKQFFQENDACSDFFE